jgi:hypothetical protein
MSENAVKLNRQGAGIIPEVWSLSLNKNLDKSGVGMKIVSHVYDRDARYGDTVNIGELGEVSICDYSEDPTSGGVTYQRVDLESRQLKIDQSKAFGIFISDITARQTNQLDLKNKFEAKARTAIDLAKDTFILSAFAEIPSENKKTDVVLTPDNAYKCLVWLAKTLKNNNAVQVKNDQIFKSNQAGTGEAMPYVVINPDVEAVLLQSSDFIHATQAGDRILREGSIGTIAGLDVLVSTNLPTVDHKVNIMAGINEAIAFVGNISNVESIRDEKFFGTNVRGLYVYGKKVVLPKALVGMTVDISAADNFLDEAAA